MKVYLLEPYLELQGVQVVKELEGFVEDDVLPYAGEEDGPQLPVAHAHQQKLVHCRHVFEVVLAQGVVEIHARGALARVDQHAMS